MIQRGDFIRLNYTGKLPDGTVFDTTKQDVAKRAGIDATKGFSPVVICVGQRMLVPGLDDALIGKSTTAHFSVALQPDAAFGHKDPKLLRIIPLTQLRQQQITPYPGLRLNIDGSYGVVRSVSSGRTVVDFNHPLASQEITYDVEALGVVDSTEEQVAALLEPLGVPHKRISVHDTRAVITLPRLLPQPMLTALQERITGLTNVQTVAFEQGTPPKE
jgi:FKBP-type peptidyl-prolyl cis-trans isomerase 2